MVDGRTRLAADVAAEVRAPFRRRSSSTPSSRARVRLAEAPSHGLPVTAYDRALRRRRRLLESRSSLSSAPEPASAVGARAAASSVADRSGGAASARLEVLIGGGSRAAHIPSTDPREPAPAAEALRRRGDRGARRVGPRAGSHPAGRRPPGEAGGYELIAGERRWRAAREAGLRDRPGARPRGRRPRRAPARPGRERRARGAVADRGSARLRRARGRVRALARRGRRAGRPRRSRRSRTGCGCSSFRTTSSPWSSAAS